ncbi:fumarylacetoacetase [Novosphingobium sp. MMS21-SN21R]|uniref:fumarylacetoacetase n=1 Tax=Novosphingobium sp. MMS21-SN21R TaxID=2969298 RepID=UPI002887CEBA|nr:fumarylacetoacetase [Novosphingobium sp. MMS21-SN21R]MDT0510249.1 fumarylacetoacetase [Novosphingobium sp. MMS21-SN21R]
MIDHTHAATASSWVPGADAHTDFPIQNLPLGIFSPGDGVRRLGVAIGDHILDLAAVAQHFPAETVALVVGQQTLNPLFSAPSALRVALRHAIFGLLSDGAFQPSVAPSLHKAADCVVHMPMAVRDYTDFYAGIHHARSVGSLLRPDNPLLPNYKYIPVGYHGRASSIRPTGTAVVRPNGQIRPKHDEAPAVGPTMRLDYEVEIGLWAAGQSELGKPIPISEAAQHIGGLCLLNDWSARDIQAWEYQPLGPFLGKNFATTISPWVITTEALAPFRTGLASRSEGDPAPLPYLDDAEDAANGLFNVFIEVAILSPAMKARGDRPHVVGRTYLRHLYWTPAQMVAHHTINGCDLAAGDLLGTGTISGPGKSSRGSLMELTLGGKCTFELPCGGKRTFLEDGDEVVLTGYAETGNYRRIGFGTCRAEIQPAPKI